ncbi:hypothetical protein MMPV_003177 [Pyropia vietnamensis]
MAAPGGAKETLDADVEEFLQEHADEFVESVTLAACRLARHRKSKTLDARDVALHLSRSWSLRVPGYGDDPRPAGRGAGAAGGGLGSLAATGAGGGAAGRGAGGGLAGGLTVEGVAAGHAARLAAVAKAAATANKGGVGGAGGGK